MYYIEFLNIAYQLLVAIGMQYSEPTVQTTMSAMRSSGVVKLIVVPMYPQYASSATGAAVEIAYKEAAKIYSTPYLHTVPAFLDHPVYIKSFDDIIRRTMG